MEDETPQQRQDNEFEVLKSIFENDLADNRKNIAWKIWRPLDLLVKLKPLHSSTADGVHCSLTLHIKCCDNYPNKVPQIQIHKMNGLSNENGAKLLEALQEEAAKRCGEVMIYDLCCYVQNFLHEHNKPTLSFYDQMLERKNKLEKLKQDDLRKKEEIERQKIKVEMQRQQEITKNEGRRPHRRSTSQDTVENNNGRGDSAELIFYEDSKDNQMKLGSKSSDVSLPCTCPSKTLSILRLSQRNNKKMYIGRCLGHSTKGSVTNSVMDAETGELLVSKKWYFTPASDLQSRNKQLTSVDNDFKATYRIKHPVLIPYRFIEFTTEYINNRNIQCVYLFREYITGCSLKCLTDNFFDEIESLKLVRHVAIGVLSGLSELHKVGVCHSDVTVGNVFLNESGAVKLVGASLDVRLGEIADGVSFGHRQTKAHDIYCTAQLLLSLISKNRTGEEIPSHLPSVVKDFFSRCFIEDSSFQWTAEQLLNHEFLRDAPAQVSDSKDKDDGYSGSEDESRKLVKKFVDQRVPASGHSRLSDEFEVIKVLGKGAFGEVIKVRNKLDGGLYAIKHIELNPENVQLNKKITREVKLLSRLNHENVVRYFNAWIETVQMPINNDDSEKSDTDLCKEKIEQLKSPQRSPEKKIRQLNSIEGVAAKLAPGVMFEWSISETPIQKEEASDSSDSEDDDDDEWMLAATTDGLSSSIEFEADSNNESVTLPSEQTDDSRPPTLHIYQALYIQMEFCEKNTLRHAIDNCLYLEHVRAWRLFREIVEGLAHVHQRGMIHRDLKPVNIFLDSDDHVKIGDFGLATSAFTGLRPNEEKSKTQEDISGSLTGQVGTALYVAPELLQAANKVIYNQKVDIYSLGIILFEMFHPPLDTGMERMMVLKDLRLKEIKLPLKFDNEQNMKQINVIRWLVNHDPSKRPTCAELLSGPHIPRPMAEGALLGLITHTLSSKGTKSYQRLIEACMGQRMSQTEDYMYVNYAVNQDAFLHSVKETILKMFRRHAAVEFSPPLLQPRADRWEQTNNDVKLMTAFGSVVHLPHDLRLPFARYTAYSDVKYMRRYTIDRVFREKSTNTHPRELFECAFDIVTPKTVLLWSDAELMLAANSVSHAIGLQVSFQINHTDVLSIVLLSCGIAADKHLDLYPVLVDVGTGRISKIQLQTHLTSLCLTPRDTANLLRLLESNVPVHEAKTLVLPVIKKNELNEKFCKAVSELEAVVRNAKAMGVTNEITFMPCLAYNATHHGGIFWQLTCSKEPKKSSQSRHRSTDLIAVGGRYDTLVEQFWQVAKSGKEEHDLKTTSVGFSMSLDRIVAILRKKEGLGFGEFSKKFVETKKVCVCVWGMAGTGRKSDYASKRATIIRELVNSQITTCSLESRSSVEAHELTNAPIVILYADKEPMVSVTCWENNNMREYRIAFADVVDFVRQKLQPENDHTAEVSTCRSTNWNESEKISNPSVSVVIIYDGKLSNMARRRFESQAASAVTSLLTRLGISRRCCALALHCSGEVVRALAAEIDEDFSRAEKLYTRFPQYRKILSETIEEFIKLSSSKTSDEATLYVLYSIPDNVCKLIAL